MDLGCLETGFMGIWEYENNAGNSGWAIQTGQSPRRDGGTEAQGRGRFGLDLLFDPAAAAIEKRGEALPLSACPREDRSDDEADEQRNHSQASGKGRF